MNFMSTTRERAPETVPLLPSDRQEKMTTYDGVMQRHGSFDLPRVANGFTNTSPGERRNTQRKHPVIDYHSDSMLSSGFRASTLLPATKLTGKGTQTSTSKHQIVQSTRKLARKVPRKVKGHLRKKSISRYTTTNEDNVHRVSCCTEYPSIDVESMHRRISMRSQSFRGNQTPNTSPTVSVQNGSWDAQLVGNVLYLAMSLNDYNVIHGNELILESTVHEPSTHSEHQANKNELHTSQVKAGLDWDSVEVRQNDQSDENVDADDEDDHLGPLYPSRNDKELERNLLTRLEVFIFDYGSVVMWNFPSIDMEESLLRSLGAFCGIPLEYQARESARDDIQYFFGSKSSVRNDCVELSTLENGERLAVSFALSQSSLMSVYEWRIEETIARTEYIPKELASTGKIKMTQDQISREVGRLFIERNTVNLESDILDTPDYFWENDEWEHVYEKLCNYLDQEKRVEILNRRLDCIGELLDVLNTQIENQHATKLEWIIIWLIVVEVAIQIVWNMIIKDILGFFP